MEGKCIAMTRPWFNNAICFSIGFELRFGIMLSKAGKHVPHAHFYAHYEVVIPPKPYITALANMRDRGYNGLL